MQTATPTQYLTVLRANSLIIDAISATHPPNARPFIGAYYGPDKDEKQFDLTPTDTPAMECMLCGSMNPGTLAEIYGSLGENLNDLCLTIWQIAVFFEKYSESFRAGGEVTFFLFKDGEEYYVNCIQNIQGEFSVKTFQLSDPYIWDTERSHVLHKFILPPVKRK